MITSAPERADEAIDELMSTKTMDCLASDLRTSIREEAATEEASVGEVTVAPLNVEPLGQRSEAVRVAIPLRATGVDVDMFADYVFIQVDRALTMLSVGSTYTEPDDAERGAITSRAVARLRDALDGT